MSGILGAYTGGTYRAKPNAPTIGTATSTGSSTATVSFTAPDNNGGATITSYTATSSPGGITGTLNQSGSGTITVSGLSPSTSYTFTVTATNAVGTSSPSAASNSITTSAPVGQTLFSQPGRFTWVAPAGVTSVSVVAVGGGSRNRAGDLSYKNNITVNPGSSYDVQVGYSNDASSTNTQNSWFDNSFTILARGGTRTETNVRDGGGNGGTSNSGCGAGGYAGNGANGVAGYNNGAAAPAGGGAGSGGGGQPGGEGPGGGGGGGTGLYGQGASGAATTSSIAGGRGGSGGSWGENGDAFPECACQGWTRTYGGTGGWPGGSGGWTNEDGGSSASGGLRIIWGAGRSFPSTNTGNM